MNEHERTLVDNLAMLVRRMAHRLSRHKETVEDAKLAEQAIEFLRVNVMLGNVQRTQAAQFGLAIVRGLLTDSQLDFRGEIDCEITSFLEKGESVREAAARIFPVASSGQKGTKC